MKLVKKEEGDTYQAEMHSGCWGIHKVLAGRESNNLTVNLSMFLPGGGVEMSGGPVEKYYHVLGGSLLVKGKNNDEYLLHKDDGIYIGAGEEREISIPGTKPCVLLVIITKPS